MSWVQILMRIVSVASKLSTTKEWCQGKIVHFDEKITGTKDTEVKGNVTGIS
jgi:hypothetical protein